MLLEIEMKTRIRVQFIQYFVHNFLVKKKDAKDSLREYYIVITILAVTHIFIAH